MFKIQPAWRCAAQAAVVAFAAVAFTGCADRGNAIPLSASLRSEGNGAMVSYTTDTAGTGYVFDATDNKLVWSGAVHNRQMIAVDAKRDAIVVDGRAVHERDIHEGHRYRIFVDNVVRE